MFTLQYQGVDGESHMQQIDASRTKLVWYLSTFEQPILAVYENATPITKSIRAELAKYPGSKTQAAKDFAQSISANHSSIVNGAVEPE